ncbi:hypothetical protein M3194_02595 [Paenibacillus glycanilyticus]|uniref:hypothetical protein n=1 Tax=Paenibacillus glycanilyticus TaxID=126569 RepID=UPI00203BD035|nr:hypothetical protein [Paenibacillus glycanilyticus]MCM3626256.1 hypothetical protein [Paenibacillus glycanilyticus]
MPKIINLFIGFIVGVILMLLPQPHIFIVSEVLNALSGGDLIDGLIHKILGTIGLVLVCLFGYRIVKLVMREK